MSHPGLCWKCTFSKYSKYTNMSQPRVSWRSTVLSDETKSAVCVKAVAHPIRLVEEHRPDWVLSEFQKVSRNKSWKLNYYQRWPHPTIVKQHQAIQQQSLSHITEDFLPEFQKVSWNQFWEKSDTSERISGPIQPEWINQPSHRSVWVGPSGLADPSSSSFRQLPKRSPPCFFLQ